MFTESEYVKAFELITDPSEARTLARELVTKDDPDPDPTWLLSPDVLDLLSLVSAECAERVRQILQLSPEQAEQRRAQIAAKLKRP
jgi:hypothetical protein